MLEYFITFLSLLMYVAGFIISLWISSVLLLPLNFPDWAGGIICFILTFMIGTAGSFLMARLIFGSDEDTER